MEIELALIVGALFTAGTYMILRRNIVKMIIGISLLGHGANLLIFAAGGLTHSLPPLVPEESLRPGIDTADPLPQALVLTAIVIGFGITAFSLVLFQRAYQTLNTADPDQMRTTDT